MSILVDTNILCRVAQGDHPQYPAARQAIDLCLGRRVELLLVPQVQREFWAVATRPREQNGLGMRPAEAARTLQNIETFCSFIPDTPAVHQNWQRLVLEHQVSGKATHDASLIAAMLAHGIYQLLTFNVEHFRRYQALIRVLTPEQLLRERPEDLDPERAQPEPGPRRERDPGLER